MASRKTDKRIIEKVMVLIGALAAIVLLTVGGLAWWAYSFSTTMVHDELASQKIYFPDKGSKGFEPAEFPDLQQYAGQLVDNGVKAKAYANGYIGRHLEKIAGGKTYAEISTAAMANPADQKLQQQKATLFQGETLRGLLVGDGYAYWTMGQIAKIGSLVSFITGIVIIVLIFIGYTDLRRKY